MKKYLSLLAAIALLLVGCATKADIESLQQQINNLTNTQIATINMQIANIQKSIGDLSEVDRELNGLITGLREDLEGLDGEVDAKYQELNLALDALADEDALLDQRIKDLKTYCDQQDNGVKSWATTTFATLEQHGAVLTEIAGIKTRLGQLTQMISDLDTSLSQKISEAEGRLNVAIVSSESSVKAWVNEKLADYYTIAQIEAKLKILEDGYKEGDEALSTEISTLRGSLETAKTELTTAYQTAIATAIEQNNGVINAKIAADIKTASDALQGQIDEMKGRLDSIEARLSSLEASVAELIGMVQSIVVVPDYSDGSVRISNTADNTIRFEVYPLVAAAAIAEKGPSILSLDYVETETKASSILVNLPITAVSYTDELLVLSVDGSGLPESVLFGSVSANARLKISDGNITKSSDFFQLTTPHIPALMTIAEALQGSYVHIQGKIMAICARGYVLSDATGSILAYYGSKFDATKYKIGDEIELIGDISAYNYGPQLSCDGKDGFDLEEKKSEGTGTVTYPTPKVIDKDALAALIASINGKDGKKVSDAIKMEYVQISVTPKKSGSYTDLFLDDYTAANFSAYLLPSSFDLASMLDKKVTVRGYVQSVSGGKHVYIVFTEMVEGEADVPTIEYTDLSTIGALAAGADFELTAVVAFVTTKNDAAIVTDGTNFFYLYKPATMPAVGDIVTATGKISPYNHLHESAQGPTVTVVESGATLPELSPKDITATYGTFISSQDPHPADYITAVGTYVVDGSYTNLVVEGSDTIKGSLSGKLNAEMNGKKVRVTGWFTGSNKNGTFIYTDVTRIEEP